MISHIPWGPTHIPDLWPDYLSSVEHVVRKKVIQNKLDFWETSILFEMKHKTLNF